MRKRSYILGLGVIVTLSGATRAVADDVWEFLSSGDDGCPTNNELVHGALQRHDLQSAGNDSDWAFLYERAFHSYEVQVTNSPLFLLPVSGSPLSNRRECGGALLTAGAPLDAATGNNALGIRWLAAADGFTWIQTIGPGPVGADAIYDIRLLDTTYSVPRFNNTASQSTVLLIQNTRTAAVTGNVHFFNAAGALLHSEPLNLAPRGLQVTQTASIPALGGQAGSALIAHLGGYGALSAKAVALEPATGFTFDTVVSPRPH